VEGLHNFNQYLYKSMKKLNLKASDLNQGEVLSRSQLRRILGGDGSGSGSDTVYVTVQCTASCSGGGEVACSGLIPGYGCSATDNQGCTGWGKQPNGSMAQATILCPKND